MPAAADRSSTDVVVERLSDHEKVSIRMDQLQLIGHGMFSNVYKGRLLVNKTERPFVAVKKTWSDGPCEHLAEVRILSLLNRIHHKNIVQLLYHWSHQYPDKKVSNGLIFEFMPTSLSSHLKERKRKMDIFEVKLFMWQIFRGQMHLAKNSVCHRDLKPQNILVDPESGLLKIGDFGSSKVVRVGVKNYSYHVTRYYRAPELILDSTSYGCEIDVWSVGCILGEMLKGSVFMVGKTTIHQLQLVVECIGMPTKADIAAMKCKPDKLNEEDNAPFIKRYEMNNKDCPYRQCVPSAPNDALELLKKILVYNPKSRLCGPKALAHPFFMDLFVPGVKHPNGTPLTVLSRQDLEDAVCGDPQCDVSESVTGQQ
uniref:Protein kinase domain-containing protein n=1 Tax=Steinernema glaseri TaxID=37863 RepID=A0A1I7Z522_9BILA